MSTKKVSEEPVKETAVAPAQEKKQTEKTVVYIGPTIGGVVTRNAIFNNGLPKSLKEKTTEIPVLKELIVPIDKLGDAKVNIVKEGSALNICYQKVVEFLKK